MKQIKKVAILIEEAAKLGSAEMKECEAVRAAHLVMIGNVLHPSVPISNNEVWECWWGGEGVQVLVGRGGCAVLMGRGRCAVLVGRGGCAVLVGWGGCAVLMGWGGCAVLEESGKDLM